jgi:lysylphosphatidylglycerol synthase-like protein
MPRLLRLAVLAAGAVVLVWLVRQVGAAVVLDLIRRVGWSFAIVSAMYFAHIAVRAAALWRAVETLPYSDVLRVRLSGEAIEMLTFTGPFLAEPAKGWLLTKRGLTGAYAYGGIAIEYLLYTLSSAWLAAAALSMLLSSGRLPAALRQPVLGMIAGIAIVTIGCGAAAVTGVGLIAPALRALGMPRFAERIVPAERVLVSFMHERPRGLIDVIAIEAAGQLLLVAEIVIVIRALGFPSSILQAVLVEGAVKFISIAFFFVPGQLGASETVYTLLFQWLGFPAGVGLTMALVRRVRGLAVAGLALAATLWIPSR